ncbi:unnamed protein product [Arctogadus glacialis]
MDSDEDVMEITQEELQKWIRKEVKKSKMVFLSAEKRCQLLSEKREKQRAGLVKLTQSVADREVVVQHLYGLLGWDYRDEDSEVEEEQQHKLSVMGSHSMGEKCGSRHGTDAEGDPERDEKPKLKRKLVQLEATSPRLETDCFPPQSKRATTRRYHVQQRNKLWSVEPSSLSAPKETPGGGAEDAL